MFGKKSRGFSTIIGADAIIKGDLESAGSLRVDGKVVGDIRAQGDLLIGSNAAINGNISANSIQLSGMVEGNIHAEDLLRMLSTAKLYGDMHVKSFVADEGAVFHGKCSMLEVSETGKSGDISGSTKHSKHKRFKSNSEPEQAV